MQITVMVNCCVDIIGELIVCVGYQMPHVDYMHMTLNKFLQWYPKQMGRMEYVAKYILP